MGLMALKSPLEKFSPLKHVPLDWLDYFETYCSSICKANNITEEKFFIENLHSLLESKDDKKWLIMKINTLRPFLWSTLKQELLILFANRCNEKLKDVYSRDWDEPKTFVEFAKEKLTLLKQIWPDQNLKKLIDIVRAGLPDEINVKLSEFHISFQTDDLFLDVLEYLDQKRELETLELENEETVHPLNSTQNNQESIPNHEEERGNGTDSLPMLEYERQMEVRKLTAESTRLLDELKLASDHMLKQSMENDALLEKVKKLEAQNKSLQENAKSQAQNKDLEEKVNLLETRNKDLEEKAKQLEAQNKNLQEEKIKHEADLKIQKQSIVILQEKLSVQITKNSLLTKTS